MANHTLSTKTAEFFYKLSVLVFFCGMPNFWIEDLYISKKITKIFSLFSQVIAVFVFIFLFFEVGAFFTDQKLNEKQEVDLLLFGISHPMMWSYTIMLSYKATKIKKIINLILQMKKVYNDANVEEHLLKKSKLYSTAFVSSCMLSMAMYTFDGFLQVFLQDTTYTTVVTAWPDVENNSLIANLVRVVWNISWWALVVRSMGVYAMIICLTANMSHQFIYLQKYFKSLDDIFKEPFRQEESEIEFEKAFKVGIELYQNTLHCVDQSKVICGSILSGQIIFNIIVLIISVSQMLTSEVDVMSKGAPFLAAAAVLIGTGLFMCNAGDITVEVRNFMQASKLATAMYSSGWQNCRGQKLSNVKQMLLYSMLMAQKPIVIYGLGIMELSYQSYVTLLKSTYSLFSVLYLN